MNVSSGAVPEIEISWCSPASRSSAVPTRSFQLRTYLIGARVPIIGTALLLAGLTHHHCTLRTGVPDPPYESRPMRQGAQPLSDNPISQSAIA